MHQIGPKSGLRIGINHLRWATHKIPDLQGLDNSLTADAACGTVSEAAQAFHGFSNTHSLPLCFFGELAGYMEWAKPECKQMSGGLYI
jgi:hypothetical protein